MPRFQIEAGRDLNYKVCYPRASFDRQSIAWDLNYFKYYFLRLAGIPFNEQALEDDFSRLTKFLLSADRDYFLYRDFQSRNVMLRDGASIFPRLPGRPQRRAAIRHRLSSVRRQGRSAAGAAPAIARSLSRQACRFHCSSIAKRSCSTTTRYVYVRIMQALGAYGFRGFYERKAHFLQSVPYALKNLRWLLHNVELPIALPTLMEAFQNACWARKNLQGLTREAENPLPCGFSVFHFTGACRKTRPGMAADSSSTPAAFRIPDAKSRFKALTGKDAPVIDYLNQQESVHQFLASAMSLVDASVSNYQRRGFKNLMVSFGCTGGQHRSVYLAEQLAKHLRGRSGVEVVVRHRELENLGK